MSNYTRAEIDAAFAQYCALRERSSATGDWTIWGNQFTLDAHYVEHAYGEFHGRDAIVRWITGVMAPFPHMTFPNDWVVIDEARGWVVFQCQNRLEHPTDPSGAPFQFPSWSVLRYAGTNQWSYEEDMYNPAEGNDVVRAWLRAGGTFVAPPQVAMAKV
ncbi:MAG: nuclear transport factor 2 family protein [Candidatus Binatia bacterium]